jgi:uncharacterized repeat protein (TIGR03806 family)
VLTIATLAAGCGGGSHQGAGTAGSGGGGSGGATAGSSGGATGGASGVSGTGGSIGGSGGTGGAAIAQTCVPPTAIDQPAAKLSQTGCMDPSDTKKLAASVVPYDVNSPLWSDGADKQRGMALPAGGKIHVKTCATNASECLGMADDGKWVLPVGTVMVKSFLFDGKLVETRLFVHFDAATWVGYSYQWDEAQTEATIVGVDGAEVMFNTGAKTVDWHYPSRMDCMKCHTPVGGDTLGPETAQMNRAMTGTSQNQIDRMKSLGMFETAPAMPYKTALLTPTATTGSTEERARSYLHANCSFCHRPDDTNFSNLDLRHDTAFKDTNTCGVTPDKGNQGTIGALVITPMQPLMSVMILRMKAAPADAMGNHGRMPKIASYVVDDAAVKLISDWITSITSCPQ